MRGSSWNVFLSKIKNADTIQSEEKISALLNSFCKMFSHLLLVTELFVRQRDPVSMTYILNHCKQDLVCMSLHPNL